MKHKYMILIAILIMVTASAATNRMVMGDGQIDGRKLLAYKLTWRQCSLQDGHWQDQGTLTEELSLVGDDELRQRQTGHPPNGAVSQADTLFDRSSFAPLRMEMEVTKDGTRVAYAERQFTAEGYSGYVERGGDKTALEGTINSKMLHGGAMGLPLATMDFQSEPLEFMASMVAFDGTYRVIAEWAGKETLEFEGQEIVAWLIDVEWHHIESGDIYPPGPDASGGRYWVVPDPPTGFPYVPRYKTDTYAVEFVGDTCLE